MKSSLRKLVLAAVVVALLERGASAGDTPPSSKYIEIEIERDAGSVIDTHLPKSTGEPLLDEATLKELRKWRFKPGKVRDQTIPIPLAKGRNQPSWS